MPDQGVTGAMRGRSYGASCLRAGGRPFRCAARIGDDEQDVRDLLVPEKALDRLVGRQRQLPLTDGRIASSDRGPTAPVGSARADDAIDRVSGTTERSFVAQLLEREANTRYVDWLSNRGGEVEQQVLDLQIVNVRQEIS